MSIPIIDQKINPFAPTWFCVVNEGDYLIAIEALDSGQSYVLASGDIDSAIEDPWKVRAIAVMTHMFLAQHVALPVLALSPDTIDRLKVEEFGSSQPGIVPQPDLLARFTLDQSNQLGAVRIRHAPSATPGGPIEMGEDGIPYERVPNGPPRANRRVHW